MTSAGLLANAHDHDLAMHHDPVEESDTTLNFWTLGFRASSTEAKYSRHRLSHQGRYWRRMLIILAGMEACMVLGVIHQLVLVIQQNANRVVVSYLGSELFLALHAGSCFLNLSLVFLLQRDMARVAAGRDPGQVVCGRTQCLQWDLFGAVVVIAEGVGTGRIFAAFGFPAATCVAAGGATPVDPLNTTAAAISMSCSVKNNCADGMVGNGVAQGLAMLLLLTQGTLLCGLRFPAAALVAIALATDFLFELSFVFSVGPAFWAFFRVLMAAVVLLAAARRGEINRRTSFWQLLQLSRAHIQAKVHLHHGLHPFSDANLLAWANLDSDEEEDGANGGERASTSASLLSENRNNNAAPKNVGAASPLHTGSEGSGGSAASSFDSSPLLASTPGSSLSRTRQHGATSTDSRGGRALSGEVATPLRTGAALPRLSLSTRRLLSSSGGGSSSSSSRSMATDNNTASRSLSGAQASFLRRRSSPRGTQSGQFGTRPGSGSYDGSRRGGGLPPRPLSTSSGSCGTQKKQFVGLGRWELDFGALELKGKVACGGGGQVFRGIYAGVEAVAVKQLFATMFSNSGDGRSDVSEFAREVAALCRSGSHPNITRLFGICKAPSNAGLYIVTEWCDGGSLTDLLEDSTRLPNAAKTTHERYLIFGIAAQIATAMAHLHQNGIAHLDLKTENCLLAEPTGPEFSYEMPATDVPRSRAKSAGAISGGTTAAAAAAATSSSSRSKRLRLPKIKVCDFGLAKTRHAGGNATASLTLLPRQGTPLYMSPEQFDAVDNQVAYDSGDAVGVGAEAGRSSFDLIKQCDSYSFGVLLAACCSANRPFEEAVRHAGLTGRSPWLVMAKVVTENLRPTRPSACPDALWSLMSCCWEGDPRGRPTFTTMVKTLTELRNGEENKVACGGGGAEEQA